MFANSHIFLQSYFLQSYCSVLKQASAPHNPCIGSADGNQLGSAKVPPNHPYETKQPAKPTIKQSAAWSQY